MPLPRITPAVLIAAAAAMPCAAQWIIPTTEYRALYTRASASTSTDSIESELELFPDFTFAFFDVSDGVDAAVQDVEASVRGSQRSLVGHGGLIMHADLSMYTLVNPVPAAQASVSGYSEWRLDFQVPFPSFARLLADTDNAQATIYNLDTNEYLIESASVASTDQIVELEPGVRYEFYGLVSNSIDDVGAGSIIEVGNRLRASMGVAPRDIPCGGDFAYPTFTDATTITTLGSAYESDWINLTDSNDQRGAVWHTATRVHARDGFETTFDFRIPASDFVDGDGFAFVIQSESPVAIGGSGSGMGYGSDNQPGITRSLAVEFDTFFFSGFELDADHISVQTDGIFENQSNDALSLASAVLPFDLNQGQTHTARVIYTPAQGSTPARLRVFLDDLTNARIALDIDLDDINGESILDADGCAFAGFTAGTGLANSNHQILSWTMVDQPASCPADLAPPAGVLNFFDIAAFLAAFNTNDPAADFAAPFGTFNFFDVAAYLTAYNDGCP